MRALSLLARFLVAVIFVSSGLGKIGTFAQTSGFLGSLGWPAPSLFIALAILFEVVGGLALMFGFQVKWAALALIVFTLLATFGVHGILFMRAAEGMAKQDQMIHMFKNLALVGGLLKFYVDAATGRPSSVA